ncbi:MAG TPA: peptidylprolyl isomerase [Gaiellaceae bacterium]|nr:peptidylprolyl isomerase [Gaiellaceae bacterium]
MKTILLTVLAAAVIAVPATAATKPNPALLHPAKLHAKAPALFKVRFNTTKGAFVVTVHRAWAPRGADRFYNLVRARFYDGDRLFRVVPGFVVQFGISPSPKISKAWLNATIADDKVRHSNTPGTMTFAAAASPNTRTTQVFVNLGNDAFLDAQRFAPFGAITSGRKVLAKLYHGYGETPTNAQGQMFAQGESFLRKTFPKLDRILTARVVK